MLRYIDNDLQVRCSSFNRLSKLSAVPSSTGKVAGFQCFFSALNRLTSRRPVVEYSPFGVLGSSQTLLFEFRTDSRYQWWVVADPDCWSWWLIMIGPPSVHQTESVWEFRRLIPKLISLCRVSAFSIKSFQSLQHAEPLDGIPIETSESKPADWNLSNWNLPSVIAQRLKRMEPAIDCYLIQRDIDSRSFESNYLTTAFDWLAFLSVVMFANLMYSFLFIEFYLVISICVFLFINSFYYL